MVKLGYKNNFSEHEINTFLEKNEIDHLGNPAFLDDYIFIEIETKNLREKSLCALGEFLHYTYLINLPINKNNKIQGIIDTNKELMLLDIEFWYNFIVSFVHEFGIMALLRYYSEVDENYMREIKLANLQKDDLFKLTINQTTIISK